MQSKLDRRDHFWNTLDPRVKFPKAQNYPSKNDKLPQFNARLEWLQTKFKPAAQKVIDSMEHYKITYLLDGKYPAETKKLQKELRTLWKERTKVLPIYEEEPKKQRLFPSFYISDEKLEDPVSFFRLKKNRQLYGIQNTKELQSA